MHTERNGVLKGMGTILSQDEYEYEGKTYTNDSFDLDKWNNIVNAINNHENNPVFAIDATSGDDTTGGGLVLVNPEIESRSVSVKITPDSFPGHSHIGGDQNRMISTVTDIDNTIAINQIKVIDPGFSGYFIHTLSDDFSEVTISSYDDDDVVDPTNIITSTPDLNWNTLVERLNNPDDYDDTNLEMPTSGGDRVAVSRNGRSGKYNSKTEAIQKIIDPSAKHTKADGDWQQGTQRAWEEYVNSAEFKSAMDKTYPNVSDEEIENIIDNLPKKATAVTKLGYKGNSAGVLSFLQDVSDDEIIRTDVKLGESKPGNDKAAVEKVIDGSEDVDDQFVEETSEDLFGEKFKETSTQNKERLINKLVDVYKKHKNDKRKQRALKKMRRMLRKDPDALAAFEKAIEETLSESLSRGSLYRQQYWGRY